MPKLPKLRTAQAAQGGHAMITEYDVFVKIPAWFAAWFMVYTIILHMGGVI